MSVAKMGTGGTVRMLRQLALIGLLLPALLFAAAAWKDRLAILNAAEDDGTKMIELVHEQAGNLFTGHEIILNMLVNRMHDRDWDTIGNADTVLNELEDIDRRLDNTSEILLIDTTGAVRATTVRPRAGEPPPSVDRACFRALRANEIERCISRPHTGAESDRYVFSLSRRLIKDGKFNGVAQVAISADYLVGLWTSATPNVTDIVTLFTVDGDILAQSLPQQQSERILAGLGKSLIGKIGSDHSGIIRMPLIAGGPERITIYKKVAGNPAYVSLSLDKNAVLATWHANLTIYGLFAVCATAGILLALGIALRRAQREHQAVERWQAEVEEREKTQEQLRQSQKMESLGKLTGGIAHDFNNLLTVIIGNLSLMTPAVLDSQTLRFRESALKASRSAATLTQRLLAFARKQVLQPRSVALMTVVDGMQSLLQRMLGPDVQLVVSADSDLWPALVDPNQIEMVILNLAANSRHAMPDGGTLSITAANKEIGANDPDAPHFPARLMAGHYVVLTVSDTGVGMDAATLGRATEPFFTTKPTGEGTGLGLSMMHGVVTQSGGAARLFSEPGRGTQIEMWLPRAHVPPEELQSSEMRSLPHGGGALLICEDDPAVLELVRDTLTAQSYDVVSVTSGRDALSVLATDESIRLLVVDFTMREMNGGAVARTVRADHPNLPILLITGNADPDEIQANLPQKVAILCKPFTPKQLAQEVSALLEASPRLNFLSGEFRPPGATS
jgi:signal transduction histidine kinase